MRPSDLLLDFGHPVAYYPGLVKYMGSPHAVIFFGKIFYWQDKAHAAEGVHKRVKRYNTKPDLHLNNRL